MPQVREELYLINLEYAHSLNASMRIDIVGADEIGNDLYYGLVSSQKKEDLPDRTLGLTNVQLVRQGKHWAEHVQEPWSMLGTHTPQFLCTQGIIFAQRFAMVVLAGFYIFFSVGLGLPVFGLLADLAIYIISGRESIEHGELGIIKMTITSLFEIELNVVCV